MEDRSQLADRILDQVADAVIYANRSGEIIRWNRASAALFGYSAEEALGSLNRAGLCAAMRTLAVIFALALIAIAGGFYSDAVLMSGRAPHADPDPATLAVAHAVRYRPESRP
jgi:PAS domain-containing protein